MSPVTTTEHPLYVSPHGVFVMPPAVDPSEYLNQPEPVPVTFRTLEVPGVRSGERRMVLQRRVSPGGTGYTEPVYVGGSRKRRKSKKRRKRGKGGKTRGKKN